MVFGEEGAHIRTFTQRGAEKNSLYLEYSDDEGLSEIRGSSTAWVVEFIIVLLQLRESLSRRNSP